MTKPKRVALVGINCNPFHLGHEQFLKQVLMAGFDVVLFFVAGESNKAGLISGYYRLLLALVGIPREWMTKRLFGKTTFLVDLTGAMLPDMPAVDRIKWAKEKFPGAEVVMVVGSDWFTPKDGVLPFSSWDRVEELWRERFLILNRQGYVDHDVWGLPDTFEWLGNTPTTGYSGVEIRALVKAEHALPRRRQTWRKMVRRDVAAVIDIHCLYLE